MKTYSTKIRLYKGEKSYTQQGKVKSANQLMDTPVYKSMEWVNFMKHATKLGYSDADLLSVSEIIYTKSPSEYEKDKFTITTSYKDVDLGADISKEIAGAIKEAFHPKKEVVQTPEQKEISDLKAQMAEMAELMKSGKDSTPEVNEELETARGKYLEVFGKKPNHLMKLATLNKEIEKELNK